MARGCDSNAQFLTLGQIRNFESDEVVKLGRPSNRYTRQLSPKLITSLSRVSIMAEVSIME